MKESYYTVEQQVDIAVRLRERSGFRGWGLGFGVYGLGVGVYGLGDGVYGLGVVV